MIPSRLLIVAAVVLAIPLFFGGVSRSVTDLALILNLVLAGAALIDLLITPGPRVLEPERSVSEVLSVGAENPVTLHLINRSSLPLQVTVHDDAGDLCRTLRLPQTEKIPAGKSVEFHYAVRPARRAASAFRNVFVRYPSRMRLWHRQAVRTLEKPIRIYPDIRAVYRYELLARQNRLSEIGVRMQRMPGQGREFERLREYRYGDEIRQIDWKATSRQRELISREFNVERNQNIVFMVDCGRFMRNESDGISYLDRALNSAIMLSYIALSQGDNVSLVAFSRDVERFVRPVRGKGGVQTMLRSTYDLQASAYAADYTRALEFLTTVQRKRALVVLLTFVTDEQQLRVIGDSLRVRSLPYLPMCVLLQDVGLRDLADNRPESDIGAYQSAAAAQILTGQSRQVVGMREDGILMVETPPHLLTERLINEYLTVKARNLM